MKKRFLVGFVTMLVVNLILVACGSSPSYSPPSSSSSSNSRPTLQPKWAGIVLTGENEPLLEGTTWVLLEDIDLYPFTSTYEFRANGRLVSRSSDPYIDTITHTWQREGDIITIIGRNGYWRSEGKYYPETQKILLTQEISDGRISEQTWELQQGSSVASRPSVSSSTTNVYVQPSAPAQSPAPAPAPSAPTFQTGTYSWSNSGVNMTMSFNAGMVAAFLNRSGIWTGTYSINGTQLVISVTRATGDYSRLQGMVYSYTITSNTSFSGSGETWVRTGY